MSEQQFYAAAQRLGLRIRQAREQARPSDGSQPTQKWLAQQFNPPRAAQQISTFENGREIPGISVLADLYKILRESTGMTPNAAEFAAWLTDWMLARSEKDASEDSELLQEALQLLDQPSSRANRGPPGPLRSLAEFPGNDPLTIILGDRREPRAKSAADCLIYSGSMTDAMYISLLGRHMENTVIRSDKLLVRMPTDYLESMPEVADRNLLIIGSPAANWGARILNKSDAIFAFRIDEDVVKRDEELRADDRMQDDTFASIFWDLAKEARIVDGITQLDEDGIRDRIDDKDERRLVPEAADLARRVLYGSTAKAMMNKFRSLGILDPADQEHHAQVTYGSNDFALVTLARNPWSVDGRYRAVICGGIHGPGTASALRELLTRPERFENYPLGAVLEVKLRLDLDWPTRFEKASTSFQTREYAAASVLEHLEAATKATRDGRNSVFRLMSEESLRARAAFVREVLENGRS
ncbi:MAG: helix-turn-helix domain-containing protein [Pseudonocardiaceae bacterium]